MLDARLEIANDIISMFNRDQKVSKAFLRGSISRPEEMDKYSDIDIGVDVSGHDNGEFARSIPIMMEKNFNVLFFDWSPSLLPDDYVITFVLKDVPIFWIVDIQVFASPHHPSLREVSVNKYHHLLKLWILNLKYWIRRDGHAAENIERLARKALGAVPDSQELFKLMSEVLKEIKMNIEPELFDFVHRCKEELQRFKN
ncbi:hypothetical protein [Falsibacillus pallidus]|uniref:Uncharacterized protein n=1 Tax=Falsibacillus pallidus TaxID=493781 RepID=A0A370GET3_9BACI|nr:hypothetical protein [Falsibacillus pallidus]RDI40924.1 hypothetical protein DFR59_11167 [Falsibacillus pallidus]